jgi:hypothetical protein
MRSGGAVATGLCILLLLAGCAAQPPIVSDPPQHVSSPPGAVPWEERYARAMIKPEVLPDVERDSHEHQDFKGPLAEKEQEGALGIVADIVAFPFRAAGWILHAIF